MKKIILTSLFILVFGFTYGQKTQFGIKGGPNIATWVGDVGDVKSKLGFHVGGFSEIKFSKKFSIQPEIVYSSQGIKFNKLFNINGTDYLADGKINSSYLNIPLMAKYYVAEKMSIETGPQIGFLITAKTEATVNGDQIEENIKEGFEDFDFGFNFGAGYDFTDAIATTIRYNLGLKNISKISDSKARNSILSLSIEYKF